MSSVEDIWHLDLASCPHQVAMARSTSELPATAFFEEVVNGIVKHRHYLRGVKALIGRNQNAEVPINSNNISRNHALLEWTRLKGWCIRDNKSINGVFVNMKKLKPAIACPLKDGCKVYLGPPELTEMHFTFHVIPEGHPSSSLSSSQVDLSVPGCSTDSQSRVSDARNSRKRSLRSNSNLSDKKKCTESSLEERLAAVDSLMKIHEDIDKRVTQMLNLSEVRLNESHESFKELSTSLLAKRNSDADINWSDWSGEDLTPSVPNFFSHEPEVKIPEEREPDSLPSSSPFSQATTVMGDELNILRSKVAFLEQELEKRERSKQQLELQLEVKETLLGEERKQREELQKQEDHRLEENIKKTKSLQESVKAEVASQFAQILESELTCIICTEMFIKATTLECSHTFCHDCLTTWKKSKKICPICRTTISGTSHSFVIDGFIEKLIEKLSPEDQEKRKEVLAARTAPKRSPKKPRRKKSRGRSRRTASERSTYRVPGVFPFELFNEYLEMESSNLLQEDFDDLDPIVETDSYYGGYGRCYNCGGTGHWANGCPEA